MDFLEPVVDAGRRAWWWLGDRIPEPIAEAFERFKLRSQELGRRVQQVVVTALLFALYFLGFGLTRALVTIFGRRYLRLYHAPLEGDSYWRDAEGYDADPERLLRQY